MGTSHHISTYMSHSVVQGTAAAQSQPAAMSNIVSVTVKFQI